MVASSTTEGAQPVSHEVLFQEHESTYSVPCYVVKL